MSIIQNAMSKTQVKLTPIGQAKSQMMRQTFNSKNGLSFKVPSLL